LLELLAELVESATAGDPMSPRKWLSGSLRHLCQQLETYGYSLSPMTVRRLLLDQDYSLKTNQKMVSETIVGRDLQFRYIRRVKKLFMQSGHPVISVDAKKRELIGNFKNPGRSWLQEAEEVNVHDFPDDAMTKATPYGIYDLAHNLGYVYVGTSANTPEFAVAAIGRWWQRKDRPHFQDESKLLILCDSGGSNGYRPRNWKKQLQEVLSDAFKIEVMVCHYPKGSSKWNPIEHRLFSFISLNWAGIPLRSLATMLKLIRGTTTQTGLKVEAALIRGKFLTKVKVSDQEMADLHVVRRRVHPQWNYVINPRSSCPKKV
jgi:Rhodopirellula transposase DDE domain